MDASLLQLSGPQRAGDGWGDETLTGGGSSLFYGTTSMAAQPLKDRQLRQQRGPGGRKEAEPPLQSGAPSLASDLGGGTGRDCWANRGGGKQKARIFGSDRFWREGPVTARSQIRVLRKNGDGG